MASSTMPFLGYSDHHETSLLLFLGVSASLARCVSYGLWVASQYEERGPWQGSRTVLEAGSVPYGAVASSLAESAHLQIRHYGSIASFIS